MFNSKKKPTFPLFENIVIERDQCLDVVYNGLLLGEEM